MLFLIENVRVIWIYVAVYECKWERKYAFDGLWNVYTKFAPATEFQIVAVGMWKTSLLAQSICN